MPKIFLVEGMISFNHCIHILADNKAEASQKFRDNHSLKHYLNKSYVVDIIGLIKEIKD